MILLSLQGIQKSFGTNEVLRDASLVLQDGQRMGLVGVNGCGKSTLMKIIAGIETADGGTMTMQKGLKLGYLAQQGQVGEGRTVLEELESVFEPVQRMEQQLRDLEHQMADAHDEASLHRLGSQYDQLTRRFEESNGYGWRSTVQGVLAGLGFRKEQQGQMASLLSGGERTRLCLGRMLLTEPDVLLLDEPTNHLDLKSIAWLEDYLRTYRGAVLLISHDRYFMDHVCDRMCELLLGATECYDGNYSAYMVQRTERFEIRMKAYELQQKEIARQEAIIARYRQFNREKSILIVSPQAKAICNDIMENVHRGATFLDGRGGLAEEPKNILFVVVSLTQVSRVKTIVSHHDPQAFMIVSDTSEVSGKGFTLACESYEDARRKWQQTHEKQLEFEQLHGRREK